MKVMITRHEQIVNLARDATRSLVKLVLMDQITQHYSEASVDEMAEQIASAVTASLMGDPRLSDLATQGDVASAKGKINGAAIVAALSDVVQKTANPAEAAAVAHLTRNFQTTIQRFPKLFER